MKYCLFCREAFEEDIERCPYCGDELFDELPEELGGAEPGEDEEVEDDGLDSASLIQTGIFTAQEDLEAAVEVLKEIEVYFEIEEVDRREADAGIIPQRAWRVLVDAERADEAFLNLVERIPQAFPREVRESLARASAEEEPPDLPEVREVLEGRGGASKETDLAWVVIETFGASAAARIARAKAALAEHSDRVKEMLSNVAVEAAASGGEGAERVLFHTLEVLEAVGHRALLPRLEALYESEVPQVRARAAWAAGRLGGQGAMERLLDLLEDEEEDVRFEASEAVWRLTGFEFEFEPAAPVEEQAENVDNLRRMWRDRGDEASVVDKTGREEIPEGPSEEE